MSLPRDLRSWPKVGLVIASLAECGLPIKAVTPTAIPPELSIYPRKSIMVPPWMSAHFGESSD
nr:MAG TPA: hypothetical protein [Caudoviricetes sp.]